MMSEMFDFSRESTLKERLYQRLSAEYSHQRTDAREPLSLSQLQGEAGLPGVGESAPVSGDAQKERDRER